MKHLTKEQLAQLQQKLEAKLAQLTQFKQGFDQANPVNDPDRTIDNSESGDEALEDHSILENDALSDEAKEMIAEVQAALDRMKNGTYGIDPDTGAEISFARLNLVPEARTAAPAKH
jgi:RNA polymerase-binding transcription factor DksA